MSKLVKNIRLCADDPMWDAHAEVPKILLTKAADRIEALEASLAEWKALAIQWAKDNDPRAVLDKDTGKLP